MTDEAPTAQTTPPTTLRHVGHCLLMGLFWTPLCVMAPAGVLQLMGLRPTEWPLFVPVLFAFPVVFALVLFALTRDGKRTVSEVTDKAAENVGQAVGGVGRAGLGCAGVILSLAFFLFVAAGVIGLLVFGVRQIL